MYRAHRVVIGFVGTLGKFAVGAATFGRFCWFSVAAGGRDGGCVDLIREVAFLGPGKAGAQKETPF